MSEYTKILHNTTPFSYAKFFQKYLQFSPLVLLIKMFPVVGQYVNKLPKMEKMRQVFSCQKLCVALEIQ